MNDSEKTLQKVSEWLEGGKCAAPYLGTDDMENIKEALELQKPKIPNLEGDGYSDGHLVYDTWICPNCESRYEMDYDEHKHCPNCGQKIDWSDRDEQDTKTDTHKSDGNHECT